MTDAVRSSLKEGGKQCLVIDQVHKTYGCLSETEPRHMHGSQRGVIVLDKSITPNDMFKKCQQDTESVVSRG
jgi:hypothetical protein